METPTPRKTFYDMKLEQIRKMTGFPQQMATEFITILFDSELDRRSKMVQMHIYLTGQSSKTVEEADEIIHTLL